MKIKSVIGAGFVVVVAICMISLLQPQPILAPQAIAAGPQQQQANGGFEYSRLVKDSDNRFVWHYGEEIIGRNQPLTVEQMTRQINVNGSRVIRPTDDTLLNNFGAQGWDIFWITSSEDGSNTTWRMRRSR